VPLAAVYVLQPAARGRRDTRFAIARLSSRRACIQLVRNTFNSAIVDPTRLHRQFALATSLAATVPVYTLSYPRELNRLPEVRDTILEHVGERVRARQ